MWLGHDRFVTQSPSLAASITFYYKLFTGSRADTANALVWDRLNEQNHHTLFYAWEDETIDKFIVHDDKRQHWTHPQEAARVEPV
jgi:hypothetical protein